MNRTRLSIAALALSTITGIAFGQNAGPNSGGPTKNFYHLKIVEPAEGATITGGTVRIVVDTEIPSERGVERRDTNFTPRPDVDVFLNNSVKGTMRDAQNVLTIEGVVPGQHELVFLAKNRSGEIIDRKVVHFTATAEGFATAQNTSPEPVAVAYVREQPAALAPVVQRSAPVSVQSAPSDSSSMSQTSRPSTDLETLPATASNDGLLAAAGLALLIGGFALRRIA
jgi:hypothetical protein